MYKHRVIAVLVMVSFGGCFNNIKNKNYDCSKIVVDVDTYPVIILGGGVAGLTAANYLAQAQIPSIVVEGNKPGGALAQSHSVQNWPGILDAPGQTIMASLKKQVAERGVEIVPAQVMSVDFSRWPYGVEIKDFETGRWRKAKALACIIAVGAEPNYLQIPGEKEYWGKSVTNCAICDGALSKNKEVAVVGGGDSAVIEALYLARIARQVHVFVRKDSFRAKDKKKIAILLKEPNIVVSFNTQVQEIIGNGTTVERIKIINTSTNKQEILPVQGLFLAIGSKPNTSLVKGQLELDEQGYIILKEHQQSSLPGVFAAGDVCDPLYKQAVTSAADGCKAALQTESFLTAINFDVRKFLQEKEIERSAAGATMVDSKSPYKMLTINSHQELAILLAKHTNVIVDLSTPLCISCQKMEEMINRLLAEYKDKVTFVKADISKDTVNVKDIERLVNGSEVTSVPTFIFVKDGREVYRFEGERDSAQMQDYIKRYFLSNIQF